MRLCRNITFGFNFAAGDLRLGSTVEQLFGLIRMTKSRLLELLASREPLIDGLPYVEDLPTQIGDDL
jgi:hypothetical protein